MRNTKTILVVDDEVYIRRAIELKLQTVGYRVITAGNGAEGLSMIHEREPDAVITDITMPAMDGKELCLRSNDIKMRRPFLTVIITARINPQECEWIESMRDTVFMEKPFSPARLLEVVDHYLEMT